MRGYKGLQCRLHDLYTRKKSPAPSLLAPLDPARWRAWYCCTEAGSVLAARLLAQFEDVCAATARSFLAMIVQGLPAVGSGRPQKDGRQRLPLCELPRTSLPDAGLRVLAVSAPFLGPGPEGFDLFCVR